MERRERSHYLETRLHAAQHSNSTIDFFTFRHKTNYRVKGCKKMHKGCAASLLVWLHILRLISFLS